MSFWFKSYVNQLNKKMGKSISFRLQQIWNMKVKYEEVAKVVKWPSLVSKSQKCLIEK